MGIRMGPVAPYAACLVRDRPGADLYHRDRSGGPRASSDHVPRVAVLPQSAVQRADVAGQGRHGNLRGICAPVRPPHYHGDLPRGGGRVHVDGDERHAGCADRDPFGRQPVACLVAVPPPPLQRPHQPHPGPHAETLSFRKRKGCRAGIVDAAAVAIDQRHRVREAQHRMSMITSAGTSSPALPRRRGLFVSLGLNAVLLTLVCGLALYAFMLNVDLGDMKRRLSKETETRQQSERYLVETRYQLTERLREIGLLKAQLAYKETDVQAAAVAAKPALPVVIGFRSSILGKGLVAEIENTSDRYLTVILAVRNPTLSTARRFKLDLEPRSRTEFGHLEGWQFASGDEVGIFNDEFGALKVTVP